MTTFYPICTPKRLFLKNGVRDNSGFNYLNRLNEKE